MAPINEARWHARNASGPCSFLMLALLPLHDSGTIGLLPEALLPVARSQTCGTAWVPLLLCPSESHLHNLMLES